VSLDQSFKLLQDQEKRYKVGINLNKYMYM